MPCRVDAHIPRPGGGAVSDVPVEVRAERMRMALAEAGYPHAVVIAGPGSSPDSVAVGNVPREVAFRAYKVCGLMRLCESCWLARRACRPDDHADGCTGEGWDR